MLTLKKLEEEQKLFYQHFISCTIKLPQIAARNIFRAAQRSYWHLSDILSCNVVNGVAYVWIKTDIAA